MTETPNFGTWSEQPSVNKVASPGISRRDFLRLAGTGMLALGIGACSPLGESNPQPQRRSESSEVPRRYARESDWNAGAITIGGGQSYLAYEPNSTGFSLYTIGHVIDNYRSDTYLGITIPGADQSNVDYQYFQVGEALVRQRFSDSDPCVEFPLSAQKQRSIMNAANVNPYLRMYDHPDLRKGAYVASPRYDLLELEGRRAWTIYQVTDITSNDLHVTSWNGSLCHGRSGGPNILIEDPNYHDGRIVPILSRRGRCIVVGVSQNGESWPYEDRYGAICYTDLALSRPILAT